MIWQLLPRAVIGETGWRGCSLDVKKLASSESPVRYQDGENVAEHRAE